MASITFSGQLDQAMNELSAEGNKILFIPQQNVGDVLEGAASEMTVAADGTYSITLAYNTYSIYHYSDVTKRKRLLADGIVVSSETAVSTIPGLIGSAVPVTEDSVLTIQGYLDEANQAKTDSEAALAETEALFDDFESSVADSMALVHTETPSLSIPFNESGKLDYGVGTEYVSGLPIYGVDFTRSTTSTVINKSGVLETLAADEMGIGADGVWLHGAYTNLINYSEDLSQSTWTKINGALINGTNGIVKVASNSKIRESSSLGTVEVGDKISVQLMAKPGASSVLSFYTFYAVGSGGGYNTLIDLDSRTVIQQGLGVDYLSIESMADDWVYIEVLLSVTHDTYTEILLDFTAGDSSYIGDGSTTDVYVSNVQLINGETALPYLPTNGSTASSTATACTVPVNGNLPSGGDSFTVICDVYYRGSNGNNRGIMFTSGLSYYITSTGAFSVIISSVTTAFKTLEVNANNRLVLTYDQSQDLISGYVNGELSSNTATISSFEFDYDSNIQLGVIPTAQYLDSELKNFKILPYAASANEVKSWGAPK